MTLQKACINTLDQIDTVLKQINEDDYSRYLNILNGATIGKHIRHVVEFFQCLLSAEASGSCNYDNRKRNILIETDVEVAMSCIDDIKSFINNSRLDREIKLEINYAMDEKSIELIPSTIQRELVYNLEHAIHHMAIIGIGVRNEFPYIDLPENFGIASSTIRYNNETVAK